MSIYLYIGTYSDRETEKGTSRGIYCYKFEESTGNLSFHGSVDDSFNPTYLALSKNGRMLFAADEQDEVGMLSAYSIDGESGQLRFIARKEFPGGALCNVNLSPDGQFLFGANYQGGNVISMRAGGDGALAAPVSNILHEGSGVNLERQRKPYAHCAMPDRAGRFLIACDLGTDKLYSYAIDAKTGVLTAKQALDMPPGEGPRHLIFDKGGRRAFVITELLSNVIRCDYAPETGTLTNKQRLSALPEGTKNESTGADIQLSPDEQFLYASNRDISLAGNDTIARYRFQGEALVLDGHIKVGKVPRGFVVSPDGKYLIVACQEENALEVYEAGTGKQVCSADVPLPVCVKIGIPQGGQPQQSEPVREIYFAVDPSQELDVNGIPGFPKADHRP